MRAPSVCTSTELMPPSLQLQLISCCSYDVDAFFNDMALSDHASDAIAHDAASLRFMLSLRVVCVFTLGDVHLFTLGSLFSA